MNFEHLKGFWHVLCESKDVGRKPKAFQLLGQELVVWRTRGGEAVAFLDRCPHRNVKLSAGTLCEDRLVCRFHGWEFNQAGQCVTVPGMTERAEVKAPGVKAFALQEHAGLVFACLDPSQGRALHLPKHYLDPARAGSAHRTALNCGAHHIAENFLDPFHTPFVHAGIIRTASVRNLNKVQPVHLENGLEVIYTKEHRQSGFVAKFGRVIDREIGRFLLPGIIELEYQAEGQIEFINTMYITPRTQTSSSLYFRASLRPSWIPPKLVYAIAGAAIKYALGQDRDILEEQQMRATELGATYYANTELDIVRRQLDHLYAGNGEQVAFRELEAMI